MIHIDTEQSSTVSSQETVESAAPKMDPALKAKWVEALRSGKFKQGQCAFERGGKFCCLGVLCEVAEQPTKLDQHSNWDFIYEAFGPGERESQEGKRWPLIRMNDGGNTFPEIADYIEANL